MVDFGANGATRGMLHAPVDPVTGKVIQARSPSDPTPAELAAVEAKLAAAAVHDRRLYNRIRAGAARQGLRARRTLRKDPRALDFKHWKLTDTLDDGRMVHRPGPLSDFALSAAEIEAYLERRLLPPELELDD